MKEIRISSDALSDLNEGFCFMSSKDQALEITFPRAFAQISKSLKFQVVHTGLFFVSFIEVCRGYFRGST